MQTVESKNMATKHVVKTPEVVNEPTNLPAAINQPRAMAVREEMPDYLSDMDSHEGKENITRDDITIPRLALAQKMSPEVDPENAEKFIDGLKIGDFFNTQSKEIYGPGPLEFCVLFAAPPNYIEFNSPEPGSGIKDMNVPASDPRTQFTKGPDGKPVKPLATKFYNYIVLLAHNYELIGLSFKSTGLKVAKNLNLLIDQRKGPIYAGKYMIQSATAQGPKGPYKTTVVKNSTIPSELSAVKPNGDPMPGWFNKEFVLAAKEYFDRYKDKPMTIEVDQTRDADDIDDSMASNQDGPGM
jgi:hypothetical protein